MSDIKPAMTADEWRDVQPISADTTYDDDLYQLASPGGPVRLHEIAARALYGQPFGFTWEDVDRHRNAADLLSVDLNWTAEPDDQKARRRDDIAWHTSMANRIAALLPPRES